MVDDDPKPGDPPPFGYKEFPEFALKEKIARLHEK